MDFLEQIFQELLTEEARTVDVVDAIKKRYEAKITYKADNDPKGSGERIIQPVAYGTTKAGNPVIRAFEPYGDTKTKVPAWKFFRLDRITSWKALRQNKFSEPPADQWRMSGAEGKFNENGDETMAEVFLVADFKGTKARYERGGLAKYNANRTARKKQDNPLHDFERNIEKSKEIGKVDYIQRNVAAWNKEKEEREKRKQLQNRRNNKGNKASISDMEKAQNFPTDTVQTVGPVKKQNTDIETTDNKQPLDYTNVQQSGPVYKTQVQNAQQTDNSQPNSAEKENNIEQDENQ